jgi:hypothetical protein
MLTLIDIRQEWAQNEVVIDPVLVPDAVSKSGWSSEVFARQIRDEIQRVDRGGRTDYPHAFYGLEEKSAGPDFTLAGGTISARAFARWMRKVISGPPRRLVAEVVSLEEKDVRPQCKDTEVNGPARYLLHARLEPKGDSWVVCGATLDEVVQKASEMTLRQISPYRLALHFAQRHYPAPASMEDLVQIREIADEMLRSDAVDQYAWALNLSGLLHARSGRDHLREHAPAEPEFSEALKDFEWAYRLKPDFSPAYINSGWVLLRLGNTQDAIKEFNKSIELHEARGIPAYFDPYTGLGFVYLQLGEIDRAIASFKKARDLEPNNIDRRYDEDPYEGLAQAWQLKDSPDGKAKADEMRKLRECLKRGFRYDLCHVE